MVDVTVWTVARAGPVDSEPPVGAEPMVRKILGATLERDPTSVRIARRCRICGHPAHGKPYLEDVADVSFSVSHSAGTLVVAVARGTEVGVDVEALRPRPYLDRLAARILTASEHAAWTALPEDDRLERFLRHWTAREAYLKAIGVGLRVPLRDALAGAERWTLVPIDGLLEAVGTVAFDRPGRVRVMPYPPVP